MAKLLPIIFLVIGGAAGAGAGFFFKPHSQMCEDVEPGSNCKQEAETPKKKPEPDDVYYITMKNQLVIPVIRNELVVSLVVLSLSLESTPENSEAIFSREPKLRDVFLQVLFDHAHIGGFDGSFTESGRMAALKVALLEAAQSVVGDMITDVVITDIVRQEV